MDKKINTSQQDKARSGTTPVKAIVIIVIMLILFVTLDIVLPQYIKNNTGDEQEVFESEDIQSIKERVKVAYDNGEEIAENITDFSTYKEHHEINGGHIGKTLDKSVQAAGVLEEAFTQNTYDGLYSPEIDVKELEMMALYHDTGMDGTK